MKKRITLVSSVLLLICTFLIYLSIKKVVKRDEGLKKTEMMPYFSFLDLKKRKFSSDSLENGNKTLLIFFNTECDHCLSEIKELVNNHEKFSNTNLVLISSQKDTIISSFVNKSKLCLYPQFKILLANEDSIQHIFGDMRTPSSLIYSSKHKLIKYISGEASALYLLSILKDN